ncbi:class E sortase [Actinokineospora guangxiensis]|uniref:Class E sortase n=1 Tax=Actinokineospora guangxiensis TaxID=1490288 RepID=A0ABW0EHY5_9PSEU
MSTAEAVAPPEPERPGGGDRARAVVRGIGEVFITFGLVILLFVVYEVYVTDLFSAAKQRDAEAALDQRWVEVPPAGPDDPDRVERFDTLAEGAGFAKMYIPAFGADYSFTVLKGTTEKTLEAGPGHYPGTALPGEPGNFAVAGHRVGKGAPFNDIDLLESCDAIVVEDQDRWYIYRVLPKADEVAGWAGERAALPRCAGVAPLGAPYDGVVGQRIVRPSQGEVISPVPGRPEAQISAGEQVSLLTLTTCHPRFSDRERLIVHAVLVKEWAKDPNDPGALPPEMKETV